MPPPADSPPRPPPTPSPPPAEPAQGAATISRAPVRYTQPVPSADNDDEEYSPPPTLGLGASAAATSDPSSAPSDEPRSLRPGQAGFAQRFMSKYGWKKGTGLGADESGIVNPLRVQVEKRRKKPDAEGGGWADPANKAKILGGERRDGGTASRFGPASDVVVLRNMLEGMPDLRHEVESGLGQEIGEECGEKVSTRVSSRTMRVLTTSHRSMAASSGSTSTSTTVRSLFGSRTPCQRSGWVGCPLFILPSEDISLASSRMLTTLAGRQRARWAHFQRQFGGIGVLRHGQV